MNTTRFCQKCGNEVEDTGGFCLLGHRLTLDAPVGGLEELRAEVDRSFEDARLEVEALVASTRTEAPVAPPPPANRPVTIGSPVAVQTRVAPAPPSDVNTASQPVRRTPPPPPPPPAPKRAQVWTELEEDIDLSNDPIIAFAPAPRIDWGPDKSKRLRRKPSRPSRRKADD